VVNLSLGIFPAYLSWFVQNGHAAARHGVPKLLRANVLNAWFQPYGKKNAQVPYSTIANYHLRQKSLFVNTQSWTLWEAKRLSVVFQPSGK